MKIILRSAAIAAMIIATSCGKDDSDNAADQMEQQAKEQEQTPLEANSMSDNVIIAGSTKEEGAPPTPNEAITMDASQTGKTAFLNEGFEIKVSSDAQITGAYVQFKANDGTVSDSYYDVDLTANAQSGQSGKSAKGFKAKGQKGNSLFAKNGEEFEIDVDFNANIEPGTFCYVVCVYDADGNISAPSEVCATVESWGGNAALTGVWNIVKEEDTYNGQTTVRILGEEDCENGGSTTTTCNEQPVTFYSCSTGLSSELTFNVDGTYSYVDETKRKNIDYDATIEACEAVYEAERLDVYKSDGYWAYVEAESRLTLVEYSWSDTEDGVFSEGETYAEGDAELIFDGEITLDGDAFQVFEEYDYDGDGIIDDTYKTFFEK